MSEWQPIETAPKDGTTILVWCEQLDGSNRPNGFDENIALARWSGYYWIGAEGSIAYGYSMGDYFEHESYFPSYWMPLPAPPNPAPSPAT